MKHNGNGSANYRAFLRDGCKMPIMFADCKKRKYFVGTMCNCSDGGMYFESEHDIPSKSEIFIQVNNNTSDLDNNALCEGYRAQVMWCRKKNRNGHEYYGIGVRFVRNSCHQCGAIMPFEEICESINHMRLCVECSEKMNLLSDGRFKESIQNYLSGNVV
ncbi:PilZ domain-containing protein [Desulfobacterales bacterium HSG16]|nr:PilZ domain-containing protein [Desulfobacterales bacterium HSG16]